MAATVPTTEPTQLRAGDTWSWSRSFSDYPAGTWTLAYSLLNSSGKISITAAADGTDYLVTVAASSTANYTAGTYSGVARVTSGAESYTVWQGSIEVLPNLAAAPSFDDRTHARKMLEAIEAALESRASSSQVDLIQSAIGDRQVMRKPELLIKLRDTYKLEVASEEAAARLAQGFGGRGRVMVRL